MALAGERTVFKCHSCATERPGNSLYCHNCGVELIPLTTCSRCQKPCCLTDSYCRFCGTDISSRAITSYKGFFYVLAKETTPIFTAERTSVVISILALVSQIFPFKLETLRELPVGQPHHLFLFLLLLALSAYNLKIAMVPDVIVLPAMVVGVVVYWIGGGVILDSIWGIIISGVPFFLVESALRHMRQKSNHEAQQEIYLIGGGTIKLGAMIGAFLGKKSATVFVLIASLFLSLEYMLTRHRGVLSHTAPYLSISAVLAVWLSSDMSWIAVGTVLLQLLGVVGFAGLAIWFWRSGRKSGLTQERIAGWTCALIFSVITVLLVRTIDWVDLLQALRGLGR